MTPANSFVIYSVADAAKIMDEPRKAPANEGGRRTMIRETELFRVIQHGEVLSEQGKWLSMAGDAMTRKQRQFVSEYLLDMNATQAAIRAGYSEKTARAIGCENLTKPYIAKAVKKAMDERIDRLKITADYVLQEIQAIVEAVKQDQPAVALKGLELLGKHLALFTERQEIGGSGGGPIMFTVRKIGEPHGASDE